MINRTFRFLRLLVCLLVVAPGVAHAQRVTVAWDASGDTDVAGYTLHYGTRPSQYSAQIDVGDRTQYELPTLPQGTYYVAVRAYSTQGALSDYSNEITVTVAPSALAARERLRTDFNNDGMADIVWMNKSTGQLAAWMLKDVSVKIEAGLSHTMPDLYWEVAGTGDFNGDKKPDLLWRHRLHGYLGVWYMDGVRCIGAAALSVPQVADTAWKIAAVGDVTGDGKADIVWQHDTGPLALWRADGATILEGRALIGDPSMAHDARWRVVGAADLNGDGQMDLLWRHTDGWLATWLMYAGSVYGVTSLAPEAEFDTAWRVVGNIDANVDGKQDILWQHSTDGSVVVWYMDGLTRLGTAAVTGGSLGGPNWKVVGPK